MKQKDLAEHLYYALCRSAETYGYIGEFEGYGRNATIIDAPIYLDDVAKELLELFEIEPKSVHKR